MKTTAVRLAALAVACATLAACTASGNINVTPTLPGGSGAPSAAPSTGASTAPSSGPSAATSSNPNQTATTKPSSAPSTSASAGTSALGNDSFDKAFAAEIDKPITGTIAKGEKEMFFKVTVPAGKQDGWLAFEIDENDDDYGPKIAWFKASKVDLGKDTYAGATEHPKTGTIKAKAGNTYYVTISPYANDADIAYNAKFTWSAVEDPNERNDAFETATTAELDKAITFATFWADDQDEPDQDVFKITIPDGKTKLRVKIANKNEDESIGGYEVWLFGSNKADLSKTIYAEGAMADVDQVMEDLTPGVHYVIVKGGNGGALSELTLSAED